MSVSKIYRFYQTNTVIICYIILSDNRHCILSANISTNENSMWQPDIILIKLHVGLKTILYLGVEQAACTVYYNLEYFLPYGKLINKTGLLILIFTLNVVYHS